MNVSATYHRSAQVFGLCGLLLALAIAAGCGPKPAASSATAKPKTEAPKTNSMAAQTTLSNEFTSDFDETLLAPKGKDPFYPTSTRRNPVPVVSIQAPAHVEPVLVLKAIIPSSKHSEAVINNAILEVGEQQRIPTPPNGHALVQCLEIGSNYVVIKIAGEAGTKRLVMEQRKGIDVK